MSSTAARRSATREIVKVGTGPPGGSAFPSALTHTEPASPAFTAPCAPQWISSHASVAPRPPHERFVERAWMSVASESPTCSASAGAQPTRRQAASKMSGLGFSLQPSSSCSPPTRIMGNKSCRAEPQRPQRWEVRGAGKSGGAAEADLAAARGQLGALHLRMPVGDDHRRLRRAAVVGRSPSLGRRAGRAKGGRCTGGMQWRKEAHHRAAPKLGGQRLDALIPREVAQPRAVEAGLQQRRGRGRPGVIESNPIFCDDNQRVPRRPRLQLRGQPIRQRGARHRGLSQRRAPVAGAPFRDQDLPVG